MHSAKIVAACAVALAISSAACNKADRAKSADEARGHEGAPINLTGCLQKDPGLGTTYILTQVNEPTRSVGTAGSSDQSAAAVERERLREAKHAYRLGGDGDQFEKLVGKQVKVQGTIAENSDLSKKRADGDHRIDVDAGDLAKVDVTTIAQVADACGSNR
jgi:hypothetical protein